MIDATRLEFRRGAADVPRVVFVYGMLGPLILLAIASVLGGLLGFAGALTGSGGLTIALGLIGFGAPVIWGAAFALKRYRRWSIERIAIGPDSLEWIRKGKSWSMPFADVIRMSFTLGRVQMRSRSGLTLWLENPTWPIYEIRQALKERALPRLALEMQSALQSGKILYFRVPTLLWFLWLMAGLIMLGLGVLIGVLCLKNKPALYPALVMAWGSISFMGIAIAFLRFFLRSYGHRVELDATALRSYSLPRWTKVPWEQVSLVTHGEDGMFVEIKGSRSRVRIDPQVDNYDALLKVIQTMAGVR